MADDSTEGPSVAFLYLAGAVLFILAVLAIWFTVRTKLLAGGGP